MCGLCGVLVGRGHWSEPEVHPDVFDGREQRPTRIRERRHRVALVNRVLSHYRLSVREWGNQYVLRSQTGKTVIINNLSELWMAAEQLSGRACDPLDPGLLDALSPRG